MGFLLEKTVEGKRCLAKHVCFWLNVTVLFKAGVSRKALQGARETLRCDGLPRQQAWFRVFPSHFLFSGISAFMGFLKALDMWFWATKLHGCSIPWAATFGVVPTMGRCPPAVLS